MHLSLISSETLLSARPQRLQKSSTNERLGVEARPTINARERTWSFLVYFERVERTFKNVSDKIRL